MTLHKPHADGPEVRMGHAGGYFVRSASTPGAWWFVWGVECSCPAGQRAVDTGSPKRCRHLRAVVEFAAEQNRKNERLRPPVNVAAAIDVDLVGRRVEPGWILAGTVHLPGRFMPARVWTLVEHDDRSAHFADAEGQHVIFDRRRCTFDTVTLADDRWIVYFDELRQIDQPTERGTAS